MRFLSATSMAIACIAVGISVLNPTTCAGQTVDNPLYHNQVKFESKDGLPHSYISCIAQDADGFMWFSTPGGLARYDGREFLTFMAPADDSVGISFNNIHDFLIDYQNQMWLVYFNSKVDKMDPRTFEVTRDIKPVADPDTLRAPFSPFNDYSRDWTVDDTGRNWLYGYTLKVMVYDTSQLKLARMYHQRANDLDAIYGFTEDSDGRLWILTRKGLEVAHDPWTSFLSIPYPAQVRFSPDSSLYRGIINLPGNRLLLAARDNLLTFDKSANSFKSTKLPPVPRRANDPIRVITKDHEGRAVIAYKGFVFRLEESGAVTSLWRCPEADYAVITTMHVDASRVLWVGTNGFGLYKIDLNAPAIRGSAYKLNFISDLMTMEMGVPVENVPKAWQTKMEKQFWIRYHYNKTGELFISNQGDQPSDPRVVFRFEGTRLSPLSIEAKHGVVGIGGTEGQGLWALTRQAELLHWSDDNEPSTLLLVDSAFSTEHTGALDMEVDNEYLWVSTKFRGLYQLEGNRIINKFLPSADSLSVGTFELTDIVNDPVDSSVLWIGSLGGGLIKWNKTDGKAHMRVTQRQGLSNNNINAVLHDHQGNIWLSTNGGVSRYSPATGMVANFNTRDGLYEDELQRYIHFVLPDGRFAFGGLKGFSILDPLLLNSIAAPLAPRLGISRLRVNNEEVGFVKSGGLLTAPLNQLESLVLAHDQNSISLTVSALEYNHPERNRYKFKLEGYDNYWTEAGNNSEIRYSNLPHGSYTLNILLSNSAGTWNPAPRLIRLTINPPYWRTWWAYLVYFVIAVAAVRYLMIAYRNRIRHQNEFAYNQREAVRLKEIDEIKTRFFSNITHEFRTPLTLILSPLQKYLGDAGLTVERATTLLRNNHRHASQLLRLVNQLLDISKLEAGRMVRNDAVGDLNVFMSQCVEHFQMEATEKRVELTYSGPGRSLLCLFDQSKWEKVVFNLLGNAMKFTSQGSIQLKLLVRGEDADRTDIRLQVSDTGIGISQTRLPRIFDRFYQIDDSSTRSHQGTGIGLALVKELTDLLGGKIGVQSEEGRGTTFSLDFTVERVHASSGAVHDVTTTDNREVEPAELHPFDENTPVVLVVEDNDELRKFIVESLSNNWRVIQSANGNDAWLHIINELPDVVVSDVMMPGMNGFELCKKAKTTGLTNHINFLMLTARAAHESKVEGLESGADDYITKPFDPYELELRIRNLLTQQDRLRKHLATELLPQAPEHLPKAVQDDFLTKLYDFLEHNLDNAELDVESIGQALAVSKSTLNRKLKAVLNISTPDLIKQFRLQKSIELIKSGYRMSEIAYAVGFESPSYFARCFKEQYQKTPTEFAKGT